jgi:hypothetical protein
MLWYIYALLMVIAFFLMWLGYTHEYLLHKLLAFTMIFLINFPFLDGFGGSTSTTLEYPIGWDEEVAGAVTEHRDVYEEFTNFWIFNILSIMGFFGFVITMTDDGPDAFRSYMDRRRQRREEQ